MKTYMLTIVAAFSLLGCSSDDADPLGRANPKDDDFTIAVVNDPLQTFAKRIAGEHATVILDCPEDVDPAHWQPTPDEIEKYQTADVVFVNGLGYAHWLRAVSVAPSKVADTSRDFKESYIETDKALHVHGPNGEHSHTGLATHVWLNPKLAIHQSTVIRDVLVEKLPAGADDFRKNFTELELELRSLDDRLELLINADLPVLGSHPVYEYLADRCEWDLHAVVWEPEEVPSSKDWKKFAELVSTTKANWMLWEDEPESETRERLTEMGIKIVVFKPCGRIGTTGYFEQMRANLDALEAAQPNP
jgi:zinc transport system substrate-binding protein